MFEENEQQLLVRIPNPRKPPSRRKKKKSVEAGKKRTFASCSSQEPQERPVLWRVLSVDPGGKNFAYHIMEGIESPEGSSHLYTLNPLSAELITLQTDPLLGNTEHALIDFVSRVLDERPHLLEVDSIVMEAQPHKLGSAQGNTTVILYHALFTGMLLERWKRYWSLKSRRAVSSREWTAPYLPCLDVQFVGGGVKNKFIPSLHGVRQQEAWTQAWDLAEQHVMSSCSEPFVQGSTSRLKQRVSHDINKYHSVFLCENLSLCREAVDFFLANNIRKRDDWYDSFLHGWASLEKQFQPDLLQWHEILQRQYPPRKTDNTPPKKQEKLTKLLSGGTSKPRSLLFHYPSSFQLQ